MSKRRLAIIGLGKMGRAIEELAPGMGWDVCAMFDSGSVAITRESLRDADVAVEFTEPGAAVPNVLACVKAKCRVVTGTTGWYAQLPTVEREVAAAGGALLWAPNFALGVNALEELVRTAGTLLARSGGFSAHIAETHHAAKKDAPSGTAAWLRDTLTAAMDRDVTITSVRTGSVPGIHEVIFDAPFEQIVLKHEARDRKVFASGALVAAAWLLGRTGVFTMRDVLAVEER